jgi:glycosyltransferase involved in cell wall biosynthesis
MSITATPIPLSVFIIANNEEDRIARAVRSVKGWAAEIVVVVNLDCEDGTSEIARQAGANRVVKHQWEGYGRQKIYAQNLCDNRWVMNLDADEEVTPELRAEISALFANGAQPSHPAYRVDAVQVFPGQKEPHLFSPHLYVVRLYDTEAASFRDSPVHDSVILHDTGKVPHDAPTLRAPLLHYSFRNLTHMVEKMNYYSSMQAADMLARGKTVSDVRLISEPFISFFKYYFLRRYFTMGAMGVVYATIYACWRTLRLAKLRESQKANRA